MHGFAVSPNTRFMSDLLQAREAGLLELWVVYRPELLLDLGHDILINGEFHVTPQFLHAHHLFAG